MLLGKYCLGFFYQRAGALFMSASSLRLENLESQACQSQDLLLLKMSCHGNIALGIDGQIPNISSQPTAFSVG